MWPLLGARDDTVLFGRGDHGTLTLMEEPFDQVLLVIQALNTKGVDYLSSAQLL